MGDKELSGRQVVSQSLGELGQPISGSASTNSIKVLVINVDSVEAIVLDKTGHRLGQLCGILATRGGSVGGTEGRDHQFNTGSIVGGFDRGALGLGERGPGLSLVSSTVAEQESQVPTETKFRKDDYIRKGSKIDLHDIVSFEDGWIWWTVVSGDRVIPIGNKARRRTIPSSTLGHTGNSAASGKGGKS